MGGTGGKVKPAVAVVSAPVPVIDPVSVSVKVLSKMNFPPDALRMIGRAIVNVPLVLSVPPLKISGLEALPRLASAETSNPNELPVVFK